MWLSWGFDNRPATCFNPIVLEPGLVVFLNVHRLAGYYHLNLWCRVGQTNNLLFPFKHHFHGSYIWGGLQVHWDTSWDLFILIVHGFVYSRRFYKLLFPTWRQLFLLFARIAEVTISNCATNQLRNLKLNFGTFDAVFTVFKISSFDKMIKIVW